MAATYAQLVAMYGAKAVANGLTPNQIAAADPNQNMVTTGSSTGFTQGNMGTASQGSTAGNQPYVASAQTSTPASTSTSAPSTSSTSSSSNSNAGLSSDPATLGLQMANIGSPAALAAGYTATQVPQYNSNGTIIPANQAPTTIATTPTTTPTTTPPASTQPQSSFSAVTGYQTGNAQLDAIVAGLQTTLNQMIASGQVINPNIALSPSDITTFLNQAKGIIDPYFSSQISQIQEGLSQNLTSLQQQWDNEQQADQLAFQQDLAKTREANAGQGTALSGGRNLQELQATQSAQNTINQQQNSLQGQAQSAVNTAAQQIGSSSTNTLPFNTYTASNQGLGSVNQSGQLAYSPINVTQGSLEAAQQTAESTQATSLAAQALQSRALGFYPSTT